MDWPVAADGQFGSEVTERPQPLAAHAAFLLALVNEQADLTLEEIRERLAECGVRVAVSSIWRFFDRHGISFKKNRARRGAAASGRGERPPALDKRTAAAV